MLLLTSTNIRRLEFIPYQPCQLLSEVCHHLYSVPVLRIVGLFKYKAVLVNDCGAFELAVVQLAEYFLCVAHFCGVFYCFTAEKD